VVGVNKAAGTLFGKHVKLQGDCLKAKNWSPSPEACLEGDPKNAILFAGKQVGTAERKQCSAKGRRLYAVPAFGYSGAQNVVDAMPLGVSGGGVLRDIFGEDLSAALASTNKKLAGCQNNVGRASADLLKAKLASYLKCTAKELISDYVGTPERLAECLDWETGGFPHSPKVAKIANKFTKNINKTRTKIGTALEKGNCSIQDLASAFPGECSGATSDTGDFMGCVDKHTGCRLCLMASGVSRLKVDCDFFDDGVTNGTCVADAVTGVGEIGMLKIPDTTMARTALQHIDGGSYAGAFGESVVHTVEEDPTGSMICSGSSECEGVEFNTVAAGDLDLDRTANMDHVIWYPAMRNYRLELVYTEYEGASWPATQAVPVYYDNESYWMQEYGGVIHHFNTIKSGNGWVRARIRKVN
jgi:hypothetical protein